MTQGTFQVGPASSNRRECQKVSVTMPLEKSNNQPPRPPGMALLTMLTLSLLIAAGQGLWPNDAEAQQTPPGFQQASYSNYPPPNYPYPNGYPMRAPQSPPPATRIMGNAYQNQLNSAAAQAQGAQNVMIILDDSDSMSENIGAGSESKMSAAKRTVLDVLHNLSPDIRVGLRIYGNSTSPFSSCHATSVLVPLGQNNRNLIASKMIGIQPTGMTPISYTLLRSLEEDFQTVNGQKTIILISDGIETCGEDPCHVAVRLQQMGISAKINVIGLGLQDYAATKQLRCVALGTKGKFYSANTAAELAQSLGQAMEVETRVQGTILVPPSSRSSNSGTTSSSTVSSPAVAKPKSQPAHQDTYLPAVPITPKKR